MEHKKYGLDILHNQIKIEMGKHCITEMRDLERQADGHI